jgi:hypothetical protein
MKCTCDSKDLFNYGCRCKEDTGDKEIFLHHVSKECLFTHFLLFWDSLDTDQPCPRKEMREYVDKRWEGYRKYLDEDRKEKQ